MTTSSSRSARSRRDRSRPKSSATTSTGCSRRAATSPRSLRTSWSRSRCRENGLEAISRFAEEGIKTNCTLIFTANQGLLAAKAGASLISPFVGRLDDINQDGMIVIRELAEIFAIHEIESEVLAASIRNPLHMTQAALAGAHIATLPFKVLQQMVHHPLTDKGIVQFKADWEKAREAAAAKA